jgi:hypothetical protein
MKIKNNVILFLINLIIIKQINSFSLENLLGLGSEASPEDDNNNELDSDDVIFKLKSFFDKYANSVRNKLKPVDKIILPKEENVFVFIKNII